jgi:hypothetical protein
MSNHRHYRKFTPDEDAVILANPSWVAAKILGIKTDQAYDRARRLRMTPEDVETERARWRKYKARSKAGLTKKYATSPAERFSIPPEVIADAQHRAGLPKPILGDPLPGYSALDKR